MYTLSSPFNNDHLKQSHRVSFYFISSILLQEKFISLALAFKTDKMTLDKRIELHERSRDIAEQNVDKELEGLKDALKVKPLFFLHWLRLKRNAGWEGLN